MTTKRVAIIGGGCSGLTAIKCCVDEGLEPVCFERTDHVGGLWRYREDVKDGEGCVMKSTIINTSKEMMCFSDFPIPASYPNFMHNRLVYEYLKYYAEHFALYPYIRYSTEVLTVTKAPNFDSTGRWVLKVLDHKSGEESTESFDAVLMCTGHHTDKYEPSIPSLEDFKGQVMHAHDYREPSSFVNKRILIIGIGNSGCDLAVELCRQGQVFLSTRRGTWLLHRLNHPGSLPVDIVIIRRVVVFVAFCLPHAFLNFITKRGLNEDVDHDLYSLTPAHSTLAQHPTINDDLPNCIANGGIIIKSDVKQFTASGVEFVDGSFVDDIDVVLLATGYSFGFPFLDKEVVEVKDNRLPFYKYMFPPDLPHHTLAAIGCVQPVGAVMPISEMQCRLAARVFKGEVKLPSSAHMWEDIRAKEEAMRQRYVESARHTIQVDYIKFMDELAELHGCKPSLVSLLKTDLALAWQVYTGPCTPYQYRIMGPGKWAGARQAIMTTMDRVRCPFATRPLPQASDKDRVQGFFTRLIILFIFLLVLWLVFV